MLNHDRCRRGYRSHSDWSGQWRNPPDLPFQSDAEVMSVMQTLSSEYANAG
jgi:hypothetical protein